MAFLCLLQTGWAAGRGEQAGLRKSVWCSLNSGSHVGTKRNRRRAGPPVPSCSLVSTPSIPRASGSTSHAQWLRQQTCSNRPGTRGPGRRQPGWCQGPMPCVYVSGWEVGNTKWHKTPETSRMNESGSPPSHLYRHSLVSRGK